MNFVKGFALLFFVASFIDYATAEDFEKIENSIDDGGVKTEKRGYAGCPEGFNYHYDGFPKCYAVLKDKLNWDDALARCRSMNPKAHLAFVNNAQESQFVTEILQNYDCIGGYNSFWIGGRTLTNGNCNTPFVWKLPSGEYLPLAYSNWKAGEPDCSQDGNACLCIGKDYNSQWYDGGCVSKMCPLCEVGKTV